MPAKQPDYENEDDVQRRRVTFVQEVKDEKAPPSGTGATSATSTLGDDTASASATPWDAGTSAVDTAFAFSPAASSASTSAFESASSESSTAPSSAGPLAADSPSASATLSNAGTSAVDMGFGSSTTTPSDGTSAATVGVAEKMPVVYALGAASDYATVTSMLRSTVKATAPATPAVNNGTPPTAPSEVPIAIGNDTSTEGFAVRSDRTSSPSSNGASDSSKESGGVQVAKQNPTVHDASENTDEDETDEEYSEDGDTEDDYSEDGIDGDEEPERGQPKEVDYSGYRKQLWASGG